MVLPWQRIFAQTAHINAKNDKFWVFFERKWSENDTRQHETNKKMHVILRGFAKVR